MHNQVKKPYYEQALMLTNGEEENVKALTEAGEDALKPKEIVVRTESYEEDALRY